jgi:hypothetical protein
VLWSQGQYVRAQRCDICLQPWDAQQCRQGGASGGAVTWWQQVALQLCRSPELAFKAWRCCILAGGLVSVCKRSHSSSSSSSIAACQGARLTLACVLPWSDLERPTRLTTGTAPLLVALLCTQAAGTHHGMSGLGAGVNTGLKLARPLAWLTLRLMPQFSVAAAVAPSLAPLLREALRCSCCVMLTEVLLTSLAGLFGGGLVGFCLGTVGVVRLSAKAGYAVGTVAARAAWPKALLLALARSPQAKQLAAALLACSRRKGSLQG